MAETPELNQNKMNGLQIAVLKVFADQKDGKTEYNIPDTIPFVVEPSVLDLHSISPESIQDCMKQLREMQLSEVFKKFEYRQEGEKYNGFVIQSKVDPRVQCSVEFGGKWPKDSDAQFYPTDMTAAFKQDLTLKIFADVEGLQKEMGPGAVPERPAVPEELDVITHAREQTKLGENITETGEPDQEYDHEFYDAICQALKKKGGFDCKHREFDKYQGVYIDVRSGGKKVDTLWSEDFYVTGKRKPSDAKYSSAHLEDEEGNQFSADSGDYFMLSPNDPVGLRLVLIGIDGKEKVIENPKKKDLPVWGEVQRGIEFEGDPDGVLVLSSESDPEMKFDIMVSADQSRVGGDIGELVSFLKHGGKMKESRSFDQDYDGVDLFGIPKEVEEALVVSVKPIGDKPLSTGFSDFKDKDHLVHKDPESKEKEVEKKDAQSDMKDKQDPIKHVSAETPIAKPESEVGKDYDEKDHDEKKIKVGDPGDDHGDHVEGTGKSPDQQQELPASKVKVGKPGDDHGKHVGESIESLMVVCDKLIQAGLTEAANKVLSAIKTLKEGGMLGRVRSRMMARRGLGKKDAQEPAAEKKPDEPAVEKKDSCPVEACPKEKKPSGESKKVTLSDEAKKKLRSKWKR